MKAVLLIVSSVITVISAEPATLIAPAIASYASQYHNQDSLGQFSYGYSNAHSSKSEARSLDGITRGAYAYLDSEGKLQSVQYTADAINGFQVRGTNIPVVPEQVILHHPAQIADTPEVAEAKAKHLAEVEKAKAYIAKEQADQAHQHEIEKDVHRQLGEGAIIHDAPVAVALSREYIPVGDTPYISAHLVPGFFYNYGYRTHHQFPAINDYRSPLILNAGYVPAGYVPTGYLQQLPAIPKDTPEVAKAKAKHLAEVEKIKARQL